MPIRELEKCGWYHRMKRRPPIHHKVRSHYRQGKKIDSFWRGSGSRRRPSVRVGGHRISKTLTPTEREIVRTHSHPVREHLYYFHNNIKTVLRPNRLRPYNVGMPVSLTSNPKAKIYPEREVRAYRVTLDFEKLRNDWTVIPVYYTTEHIFSGDYWKVPKNVREYYENTGFPITDRDNFLTLISPKETYAQESEWASFEPIENLHKYATEMRGMEKDKKLSFEIERDYAAWEEDAWYMKLIPESANVRTD